LSTSCGEARRAIEANEAFEARRSKGPKSYADVEAAVEARVRSVQTYPGSQFISREAAQILVDRFYLRCTTLLLAMF